MTGSRSRASFVARCGKSGKRAERNASVSGSPDRSCVRHARSGNGGSIGDSWDGRVEIDGEPTAGAMLPKRRGVDE